VNQGKTEACLFYKHDCAPVTIQMGEVRINTKKWINVLGVVLIPNCNGQTCNKSFAKIKQIP
jgi:hypothetical protein